jgi:hypothetical protein
MVGRVPPLVQFLELYLNHTRGQWTGLEDVL